MSAPPVSVLFVDDDEGVLRAVSRALDHAPFELLTTSSPAEALRLLGERPIDVVVSDLEMPLMGGLDLLRIVRLRHPLVLRMVLTGGATVERALEAINVGEVARLFEKPFDVRLFRDSIVALMERIERARREGAEAHRAVRHQALVRWAEDTFAGVTRIEEVGRAVVDLPRLQAALEAAGGRVAADLLRGAGPGGNRLG